MNARAVRWLLVAVAVALLLGAAGYLLYPRSPLLQPLPVGSSEQEVAWLYPATAPANWNRFIMALARIDDQLADTFPGLRARIDARTFPVESAAIPEAALEWPDGRRLVFRWYKTTSEQDVDHWVQALVARSPAPLAILGGNTSDAAYRVVAALARHAVRLPEPARPVMLLTTGTADRWIPGDGDAERAPLDLLDLYPERTFRVCFSNAQMARATCDFIWSEPDLRPDRDPAYLVHWLDDSYSRDLIEGYLTALKGVTVRAALDDVAWVLGVNLAPGGGVLPVHRLGPLGSNFRLAVPHSRQLIDSSVGTFSLPNRFEQEVSNGLLRDLADHPTQLRPLVAVTGQTLPCRRFLRAIVRSDPVRGRQFVVATGDGVSFTNLYRDRLTHWPIQDLPFPLVAFAHANPIDTSAGFQPEAGPERVEEGGVRQASQAGTDDLLLLENLLRAVALASRDANPSPAPEQFAQALHRLRSVAGRVCRGAAGDLFFDARGNRTSETGEHVMWLRPRLAGERVLPAATLEVYRWGGPARWERVGAPLHVLYAPPDPLPGAN